MEKRVTFNERWLPYLLVAPQMIITLVFFFWPSAQAVWQSVLIEDAFGGHSKFVWFENFVALFEDPAYFDSVRVTLVFSALVAAVGLALSLLLAVMADRIIRGASFYKMVLVWPYAVAPAVAGVLWGFLFNPAVGVVSWSLKGIGIDFNYVTNANQALALIIIAAVWNQVSYNFLFFLAGLQSIPKSLIEAAAIDGAGPGRRFWDIVFPMLSPTGFFLLVINIIYAFFGTFGVVASLTQGGPGQATNILVYKVWNDGFRGQDLGGSSAQSVILMIVVILLTVVQFRFIERRLELGIVGAARRHRSVAFEPFFRDEVILACPPGHPFAGRTVQLAELDQGPLILMQHGAGVRQMVEDELRRSGRKVRDLEAPLELGLQESVRTAIQAGYGVGFISRRAVESELAAGTLAEARVRGLDLARDIFIVRAAGRAGSNAAQAFVAFARDELRQ
jgi:sn-glycerol 3-phosphate transport system permease protein